MKAHWIMTIAAAAGLSCFTVALPVRAADQDPASQPNTMSQQGQLDHRDMKFIQEASRGGIEEVQLGQMAEQKAANPAVKEFAQRMVTDHSKANDELRQLAGQKGINLPTQMSSGQNDTMEDLQKLNGTAFDQAYAKDMVKDHHKDVREFEKASKNLTDPDLRAWAQKTLAVLQQHLQLAENLEATVKGQK